MPVVIYDIHWYEKNDNSNSNRFSDFGRISIFYGNLNK